MRAASCFNCRVVIPKMHEELAQLRRDLGILETILEDVSQYTHRLPDDLAAGIWAYFAAGEPDLTVADMEQETWPQLAEHDVPGRTDRDPGDETGA